VCPEVLRGGWSACLATFSLSGENEAHPAPHFAVSRIVFKLIREVVDDFSGLGEVRASPVDLFFGPAQAGTQALLLQA
jgi:hypothetical protein